MGFCGVLRSGFRVWGSAAFCVQGLGFGVLRSGFRVWGFGRRLQTLDGSGLQHLRFLVLWTQGAGPRLCY